jgi:uncharacterized RDD family membrane protein YckC
MNKIRNYFLSYKLMMIILFILFLLVVLVLKIIILCNIMDYLFTNLNIMLFTIHY